MKKSENIISRIFIPETYFPENEKKNAENKMCIRNCSNILVNDHFHALGLNSTPFQRKCMERNITIQTKCHLNTLFR